MFLMFIVILQKVSFNLINSYFSDSWILNMAIITVSILSVYNFYRSNENSPLQGVKHSGNVQLWNWLSSFQTIRDNLNLR